jgi:phenylpropionate dioxygenase-like ring-hydroxylating dioxygenase large terminal subunit
MCSYHGWQFDADGHCVRIPQAENPQIVEQNPDNFCLTLFPTQEAQDLLWVWPDAATSALAAQTSLPLSPQIQNASDIVCSSIVRDLAYDWQTLVENVADPSHVPFAHHGVQGNRAQASPVPIQILQSTPTCIEAETGGRFRAQITFEPPCRLEYSIDLGKQRKVGLVTYCIPTEPGRSRIVAQFPRNFAKALHYLIPRWWEHIQTRNAVLDGDMVLLHYQERVLAQTQATQTWKTAYIMPTGADRLVIEFRRWMDKYGHHMALNPDLLSSTPLPREVLLDRYHQHTEICSSCRSALRRIQQVQRGLIGFFAGAIAIAVLLPTALWVWSTLLVGVALVGLGVAAWLRYGLEPRFRFVDYVHADR